MPLLRGDAGGGELLLVLRLDLSPCGYKTLGQPQFSIEGGDQEGGEELVGRGFGVRPSFQKSCGCLVFFCGAGENNMLIMFHIPDKSR